MSIDFDENENADYAECVQNSHSFMNDTSNNFKKDDLVTFKNYLNFSRPVTSILAHQVSLRLFFYLLLSGKYSFIWFISRLYS